MTTLITEGLTPHNIFFRRYIHSSESIPLVLVMGYGGSLHAWPHSFVQQLSQRQEVIVFDNRGTGRSYRPNLISDFSVSNFAKDLQGLVDHLKLPKINLLGYSLGGCIALQFAYENPQRVNQLILMSTTAGGALYTSPGEDVLNRLLNPQGDSVQEMFMDTFSLCLSESNKQKYDKELIEIFQSSSEYLAPRITLTGQIKAYREFDAKAFLAKIVQQVKIIHGKDDRLTPVDNARKLADHLANAELIILDNCEHCPHIEQPSRIIGEICFDHLLPDFK
jgi:pimeloyl-ACP methyl ester carboxylesterase